MTASTGKGRGRPKGARNKRTAERVEAMEKVADVLSAAIPDCFEGDGVAYLQGVYKDARNDVKVRVDAAYKAANFERPRLTAIESTVTHKHDGDDYDDAELEAIAFGSGATDAAPKASPKKPN